ncbi:PREDICTED: glutaminase kidney isoform, mitochondrial-like [Branchiostoma belcheri]|uniref:glutaminase n=1 Tax=Branchiostoma belcheri TaxID=7741 RepID=A0A6P4ZLJ2_BRABE|nr:PREDICTED: glutaminase kidney isoform, mitochondrial-like [Branchiostoma belcheri]XP_019634900.1 PREDICTED: glutaminase kidney isoform, mitochondrial-like [Branchiostoma belcheri]XP_019634901.1 PREDICTED: glutaminase kidney isoform, mitochondrial-like [Branchiostoma belcheri]
MHRLWPALYHGALRQYRCFPVCQQTTYLMSSKAGDPTQPSDDQTPSQNESANEGDTSVSQSQVNTSLPQLEDWVFRLLCNQQGRVPISEFQKALREVGLWENDPRLKETMVNMRKLQESHSSFLDRDTFSKCITENIVLIGRAFQSKFVIPKFSEFSSYINKMYWLSASHKKGKVADYIPQLARFSPDLWGVALCTVDGQRHSIGDSDKPFCLQSCVKPLVYATAVSELGDATVHRYVGTEPSGRPFNEIALNKYNQPFNPMINSGAILLCSLIKPEDHQADRFDHILRVLKAAAADEFVGFSNTTFLSEKATSYRNFALAYYLKENKCFPPKTDLMEALDLYLQHCSVEITCESGAVIAATLANGGVCPLTGELVFHPDAVQHTLSLMHSCGMYDYSGQFAFQVGLPAKSGVAGGIMLVVPSVMGIMCWSPPLDSTGNSVRGLHFCKELVSTFNFHHYDNLKYKSKKLDPRRHRDESRSQQIIDILFAAYNGDVTALRRCVMLDMDMEVTDYDGRTALHLAAAEGHVQVVRFLLEKCGVRHDLQDRWGQVPLDDAVRFGHKEAEEMLRKAGEQSG